MIEHRRHIDERKENEKSDPQTKEIKNHANSQSMPKQKREKKEKSQNKRNDELGLLSVKKKLKIMQKDVLILERKIIACQNLIENCTDIGCIMRVRFLCL